MVSLSPVSRRAILSTVPASLAAVSFTKVGVPPSNAAGLKFSDVPTTTLFYTEIMWAAERGLVSGSSDGLFHPLSVMDRGTMAVVLHRLAGSPSYTAPTRSYFSDVPVSYSRYRQICWLVDAGITYGWGDGLFRPRDPVNRIAMAAFLYRMAGSPAYVAPAVSPFIDVTTDRENYREVCWMVSMNISTGWSDGTFRPLEAVQRNAICAFLYRYSRNVIAVS